MSRYVYLIYVPSDAETTSPIQSAVLIPRSEAVEAFKSMYMTGTAFVPDPDHKGLYRKIEGKYPVLAVSDETILTEGEQGGCDKEELMPC